MSYIERLRATSKAGLFLVYGRDLGKKCWYYVEVDRLKTPILEARVRGQEVINLAEFGRVVVSGWGVEPPELVKARIEEFGANYNPEQDAELAAYYEAKTDVFFISAKSGGRDAYYYVAVSGRLADEFNRVCNDPQETPNLEDYGNILESGWGQPSPVVIAYMWEKYGARTPEIV